MPSMEALCRTAATNDIWVRRIVLVWRSGSCTNSSLVKEQIVASHKYIMIDLQYARCCNEFSVTLALPAVLDDLPSSD